VISIHGWFCGNRTCLWVANAILENCIFLSRASRKMRTGQGAGDTPPPPCQRVFYNSDCRATDELWSLISCFSTFLPWQLGVTQWLSALKMHSIEWDILPPWHGVRVGAGDLLVCPHCNYSICHNSCHSDWCKRLLLGQHWVVFCHESLLFQVTLWQTSPLLRWLMIGTEGLLQLPVLFMWSKKEVDPVCIKMTGWHLVSM
jgi:hypothetical protein